MFLNDETTNPSLTFSSNDLQAQTDAEWKRVLARDALNDWKSELQLLKNTNDAYDQEIKLSKQHLIVIRDFLNRLSDAVLNAISLSSATLDTYKANVNTARTNVSAAYTNISNQDSSISSQKFTVSKYKNTLDLKIAGSTPEQIAAQEAEVKQVQANLVNYQAQLEKTILKVPFNGIVTKKNIEQGEISSLTETAISMISNSNFEIEADIPEADIAKIKIFDTTKVTLDAYGNDIVFDAKVTKIDPAETMVEGVATYKTTLIFIKNDSRIKSGMTANTDILTDKKDNVLIIPRRAIISDPDGNKSVKILNNDGTIKEVFIKVGLQGSDGNAEITQGINEGDRIIIK
ncbi:MAG: efflux RND transporter periplasmic adaptor subunit [Patescibacteria group bacterium]|nr:efflux RND transporter periplasmic adaptor subunit [Patescibacteria group bacterium]